MYDQIKPLQYIYGSMENHNEDEFFTVEPKEGKKTILKDLLIDDLINSELEFECNFGENQDSHYGFDFIADTENFEQYTQSLSSEEICTLRTNCTKILLATNVKNLYIKHDKILDELLRKIKRDCIAA